MAQSNLAAAARRTSEKGADAARLLAWYDLHRRNLPWRAKLGEAPDPYRVWLSEIMLQQTRTETVARYYARFIARFPSVERLAAAKLADVLKAWAGLGYYARARNLHACARAVVKRHGGRFPAAEEELRALPGIGAYTAAAIVAIAFGRKATPVDGNIERVIARRYAVGTPLPAAKPELKRLAENLTPERRAGDFAQAMMDLGATLCAPKRPSCLLCPWNDGCEASRQGMPESFPRRAPKAEGALRRGAAFVAFRADGAILLRSRPPRGLLGGMTEVPTTEWRADFHDREARKHAPLKIKWRRLPGRVRHVFTHFPLELEVYAARVPEKTRAPKRMRFAKLATLADEALPSLMRKVVAHALDFETKPDKAG
ncbi:MAG TPA: A/G-specific adenine glycosylase [Xanthobacteraceae bacterium]|nr:A/G-specific adenine glycosylase [Xanthobacteraceae bacterium]